MPLARQLPAGQNPSEKPDAKIRGLYIREWPSGKRSAAIRYVVDGRQRRHSLGVLGEAFTLDQARSKAKRELGKVHNGADPSRDRKAALAAETFAAAAKRWLDEHVATLVRDPESRASRTPRTYSDIVRLHLVPQFGNEKIARITRDAVEKARREISKAVVVVRVVQGKPRSIRSGGKGIANRAMRVASAIFDHARVQPNPCKGIKPHREKGRSGEVGRSYSALELARIDDALDTASVSTAGDPSYLSPSVITAIRLLLLTGARASEVTNMRWSEVDLDHARLDIAVSKTGRSIRPMQRAAVELLRALKKERGIVSEYVCPTNSGKALHPRNVGRAWESIRRRTGVTGRLHDLRHTAGSMALAAGVPLPVVSKMLGHKSVATTARIYAHVINAQFEMDKFSDALEATLARGRAENAEATAKVLPMRAAGGST